MLKNYVRPNPNTELSEEGLRKRVDARQTDSNTGWQTEDMKKKF